MSSSDIYTLRDADMHDLEFLFGVVIAVRQSKEVFDWGTGFREFKKSFIRLGAQVVLHKECNIGRLRIARSTESIYVGGIQLLPAFQSKGICSAIFADLIQESKQTGIPLSLSVFVHNVSAFRFYTRLGFVEECTIAGVRDLVRAPTV
jgi:GNAT superfamily N-acetyltransferase